MIHAGKGVVVTGGAKGIGRGIVERFCAEGAHVVIADVDESAAQAAAAEIGGSVRAAVVDVRDEDQIRGAIGVVVDMAGHLDVMVNNAGVIAVAPIVDTTAESWRRIMDINVVGVALGSKIAAEQMIAQGMGGVIVNASSGAGRHGVPNFSQYCASKAAIIMMSQSLAQELAPHRIRVNCYTPGHIMTPLWEDIVAGMGEKLGKNRDETLEAFLSTVPWGRFGTPADVAAATSWLCTDDAEYVSGQCIAMNGAELPW
jgi:NAD(P)-dependent dehydrogenase (short-subunit alcohol dehydrogenase family)